MSDSDTEDVKQSFKGQARKKGPKVQATKKGPKPEARNKVSKNQAIKKAPFFSNKLDIREKYEKLKGKSLYLRFPHQIPTDEEELEKKVKSLCSRIIKVRRPRRRSVRFCLVDFATPEDRQKAMKELKAVVVDGTKLHVELPNTENEEFIEKIVELQAQRKQLKKVKSKLSKIEKKTDYATKEKIFTSSILVKNIPSDITEAKLKDIFAQAVEIKLVRPTNTEGTCVATITLPTPKDATKAKNKVYYLGDNRLKISFAKENATPAQQRNTIKQEKGNRKHKWSENTTEGKPTKKIKMETVKLEKVNMKGEHEQESEHESEEEDESDSDNDQENLVQTKPKDKKAGNILRLNKQIEESDDDDDDDEEDKEFVLEEADEGNDDSEEEEESEGEEDSEDEEMDEEMGEKAFNDEGSDDEEDSEDEENKEYTESTTEDEAGEEFKSLEKDLKKIVGIKGKKNNLKNANVSVQKKIVPQLKKPSNFQGNNVRKVLSKNKDVKHFNKKSNKAK